jgi:hypothetical protein
MLGKWIAFLPKWKRVFPQLQGKEENMKICKIVHEDDLNVDDLESKEMYGLHVGLTIT